MLAAHRRGLRTVALTDHDTTSGWAEAADAAVSLGLTLLPGMELSARDGHRSVHVLGYLFDPDNAAIRSMTDRIRDSRLTRAQTMADRIGADYALTWEDVLEQTAEGATVGRPHLADALVARGHVRSREEAFSSILHPGSSYYVSLYSPDPVHAVRTVVEAGGVAVIAHPAGRDILPMNVVNDLISAGLGGFELGHRENRPEPTARLREVCERLGLIVTGSSDYHGVGKPNLPGEHTTRDEMVERIIASATGSAPVYP